MLAKHLAAALLAALAIVTISLAALVNFAVLLSPYIHALQSTQK